jgi:D-alanine-D-alanine ligase
VTCRSRPAGDDARDFGRVAVLMGGTSAEREVSLDSGRNVLEALQRARRRCACGRRDPGAGRRAVGGQFDRVFNILHGNRGGGEDGVLQGLLEALEVPYTGCGVLASALTMDKIRTKQVWMSAGLPTPKFLRLSPGADVRAAALQLGLPVFVKPSSEGSSVGVARVTWTRPASTTRSASRAPMAGELLMEQMVAGDEFTVGIFGDTALPSIRIVPAGEWYDYHAKYIADDTQYLCPGLRGRRRADRSAISRCARSAPRAAAAGAASM